MMLHARFPTWTQLALAFYGFGVVSAAQGQACETVTIEELTDYFPGEIDWVLTGTPGPNEEGCVGPEVCLDVWVEDDVTRVAYAPVAPLLMAYPNPAQERLTVQCEVCQAREQVQVWNSMGALALTFTWEGGATQPLDVKSLPAGVHTLQVGTATTAFIVE